MSDEYISFYVKGKATWAFLDEPRKPDTRYEKPAMFSLDLRDFTVEPNPLSPIKTNDDLKKFWIRASTMEQSETREDGSPNPFAHMDGAKFIRFQSKVGKRDNWKEIDPELLQKRKPKVIDSLGNELPPGTIIGNDSIVKVKGTIRNKAPEGGRKAPAPFIDVVQVLSLVTYDRPEGTGNAGFRGFDKVEGGYVAGTDKGVTKIDIASNASTPDDSPVDDLSALERLEDLEPRTAATTRKKKAA